MAQGCVCTVLATKSAPDELFRCGKVLWVGNELGQARVWSSGYGLGACGHFVDSVDTLNPHYQRRICGTGVDESYQDREYNHINDLQHIGHRA